MKTYKHLFELYLSDANIEKSIRQAKSGQKSKRKKAELQFLLNHLDKSIPQIREVAKNIPRYKHIHVEIYDNHSKKNRVIIVPSSIELILQHMVINVIQPILIKRFYAHSYASTPNKGLHKAQKFISHWIRMDKHNTKYYVKLDIHHFFESIDTNLLKSMLSRIIKDKQYLTQLFTIIDNNSNGLPLGFYTSQWLANFYLSDLDRYIKEKLRVKYYVRYMDDMVLLGANKRNLRKAFTIIKLYIEDELHLQLKSNYQLSRIQIDKSNFLDFIGLRFYQNRTILRKNLLLRMTRKARKISKKLKPTVYDARQMVTYIGWLNTTNCFDCSLCHVYPYTRFTTLRTIISKHDKQQHLIGA